MKAEDMSTQMCQSLEAEISAFVDGELKEIDAKNVMDHLNTCPACQGFVDFIRQYAHLHRDAFDEDAVLESFDGDEAFQGITSELLIEKILKVAELFYQLGKAYLTKGLSQCRRKVGNKTKPLTLYMATRPLDINKARMRTNRLFREMKGLSNVSDMTSKTYNRASSFFRTVRKQGNDQLEIGRRFVEESLAIDPDRPEPRIFLGCYFSLGVRNYEKAREQFRRVLMISNLDEERRAEALINLGLAFKIEYAYEEALACFREVVKSGVIKRHPRFHRCLIFLAITYAKLGKFNQSIAAFQRPVKEFPRKIKEIRKELWDMRTFQNVVESEPMFRRDLERKIPVLFAS